MNETGKLRIIYADCKVNKLVMVYVYSGILSISETIKQCYIDIGESYHIIVNFKK
jgi:hypothetical protein